MKPMTCLAATAFLLGSQPASPSATPHPTAQDNRIREAIYSDTQVFRIVGVFRSATQIVFSPGERVEHVALGDTVSWEVAPAEHSLFIKPRELAGSTNLIVITRSDTGNRTYTLAVGAARGNWCAERGYILQGRVSLPARRSSGGAGSGDSGGIYTGPRAASRRDPLGARSRGPRRQAEPPI